MNEENTDLLPSKANKFYEEYLDYKNINTSDYAVMLYKLRLVFEEILNNVCYGLMPDHYKHTTTHEKWKKETSNNKINSLKDFFTNEGVYDSLHNIRNATNNASHANLIDKVSLEDVTMADNNLRELCKNILIEYLLKEGKGVSENATLLSSLQPKYRIDILNKLFDNYKQRINGIYNIDIKNLIWLSLEELEEKSAFLISVGINLNLINLIEEIRNIMFKLAMAYVKNNEYEASLNFSQKCYEEGYLDNKNYQIFIESMETLYSGINKKPELFQIPKNNDDTMKVLLIMYDKMPDIDKDFFKLIYAVMK